MQKSLINYGVSRLCHSLALSDGVLRPLATEELITTNCPHMSALYQVLASPTPYLYATLLINQASSVMFARPRRAAFAASFGDPLRFCCFKSAATMMMLKLLTAGHRTLALGSHSIILWSDEPDPWVTLYFWPRWWWWFHIQQASTALGIWLMSLFAQPRQRATLSHSQHDEQI